MGNKLTLKQKGFVNSLLDKNSDTFSNGTKSALEWYNTDNPQTASAIASENLRKPSIVNYLEQRARELGIGIEVRLSNYGEIASARTPRRTVSKLYKKDKQGNLVLVSKIVTDSPVKDSDRIKAMQSIDTLTGTKEQREIDKVHALKEYDDLYKRIVGQSLRDILPDIPVPTADNDDDERIYTDLSIDVDTLDDDVHESIQSEDTSSSMINDTAMGDDRESAREQDREHTTQDRPGVENFPDGTLLSDPSASADTKKGSEALSVEDVQKKSKKNLKKVVGYDSKDVIRSLLKGV